MPKLIYQYIIVFTHNRGNGRMELFRTNKIKSYADIESIDKYISDTSGFKCTVIGYKLLNVKIRKSNFFDTLNHDK